MYKELLNCINKNITIIIKHNEITEITGELLGIDEYLNIIIRNNQNITLYYTRYIIEYIIPINNT
ncbi:hypothetical protein NEIG_00248 [Nematocida sp. ERTm5]|nr:hypothetical protein NEIG_00248 [Nematocida sp. ERTm5]